MLAEPSIDFIAIEGKILAEPSIDFMNESDMFLLPVSTKPNKRFM